MATTPIIQASPTEFVGFVVDQPMPAGVVSPGPGLQVGIDQSGIAMYLGNDFSPSDLDAVNRKLTLGFTPVNYGFRFVVAFSDIIAECFYSELLIPTSSSSQQSCLVPITADSSGYSVKLVLFDIRTNIVKLCRVVGLSNKMSRAIYAQSQAAFGHNAGFTPTKWRSVCHQATIRIKQSDIGQYQSEFRR